MRILALDIGTMRIGIAVSDASAMVASPLAVLSTQEVEQNTPAFRRILEDYAPELLLVGLPVSLSGGENEQAAHTREIATKISTITQLPLAFQDERLSSAQAKRILREQGCTERDMRGRIDAVAASLFLQTYLDAAKGCL
ncbi:MAG: Holliday junction resolvase RuvX [Coriobacteriales bacterium]|jgi:putative Holliday junction resolvase|nr:Holliday junction resolvase RuvX [Coriobacteriales bacterium]